MYTPIKHRANKWGLPEDSAKLVRKHPFLKDFLKAAGNLDRNNTEKVTLILSYPTGHGCFSLVFSKIGELPIYFVIVNEKGRFTPAEKDLNTSPSLSPEEKERVDQLNQNIEAMRAVAQLFCITAKRPAPKGKTKRKTYTNE